MDTISNDKSGACSNSNGSSEASSTRTVGTDDLMGNGTSQSIVLGSPRFQSSAYSPRTYYDNRGLPPKYAHPQNRVLPKPVAGQRLRSTDNGSILQTAGTIRGQRRSSVEKEDHSDPEVMGILRRRSEMVEKENDCYHQLNLRNHRLFHSDPNIARRPVSSGYDDSQEMYANRRSCNGGVAVRASKLKYKKKARAPEPPPSGSSLPRQIERRPQSASSDIDSRNRRNMACKCIIKPKAPQPPAIVVHPPPPPPLPSSLTTRTKVGSSHHSKSQNELSSRSPSVTRAVASKDSRMCYEKNVHPLEKWRNCRSTGDVRLDEQEESQASRTTVFDSRKISESQTKLPSYLPLKPDPFQKEIQAVTKKIAESRQDIGDVTTKPTTTKPSSPSHDSTPNSKSKETNSPPKFYFADVGIFKMGNKKTESNEGKQFERHSSPEGVHGWNASNLKSQGLRKDSATTTIDEIVPSLQRFSPGRNRVKSPSRSSTPIPQQNGEGRDWDRLARNLHQRNSLESDIDLRLRPVLPRKTTEVPKFSASEAWQALGSDGMGSSNHSTSDDGRDGSSPYLKSNFILRNPTNDKQRGQQNLEFDRFQKRSEERVKQRSMSDSHWTPRQDLLDDSDVSSEDSEEAVVPKIQPDLNAISTRFSLPTVMFSNMRPIGSELKSSSAQSQPYINGTNYTQSSKKKVPKQSSATNDNSIGPTFKRFLSKRNKYLSEEDIAASDSNWTFGQHGLQKRGKQYSSDLMLSDKKKYEFMVKSNFSDFLGDILMSNADHLRKQMKSSDSGNSNFSFYSTEGQIMYAPENGGFVKKDECSPPSRGRVYDMRRRFDSNFEPQKPNFVVKSAKKKGKQNVVEMGRKRDLELAKMLEDEVRKRRNKEKITIRQQLQRMKSLHTDDEDEEDDFDDEAYFTEPKSRDDSQSPFFSSELMNHPATSELGIRPMRYRSGPPNEPSPLSHWQSSPALLEDSMMKNGMRPTNKGRLSLSSVMSSPDPEIWTQKRAVDTWLTRQRHLDSPPKKLHDSSTVLDHSGRMVTDHANDGDVSSSPTPAPPKKERRKTNIYKQLMDIVRKEERHLKKAQKNDGEANSRDSSYSQRESSPSTCSESSSTSSYSYSDSSSARNQGMNGVPANKEFHTSGYSRQSSGAGGTSASFQVSFVQPYSPIKSYRPVPFDIVHSAANNYRMPGLQEEGKHIQAEVS